MENYIKGKAVLITGGTSGFGLEAARLVVEMGGEVAISGRDAQRLDKALASLGGNKVMGLAADACKTADWKKLIGEMMKKHGRIDCCLMCHGAGVEIADTDTLSDETIDKILNINIGSVIKGSRELCAVMKPKGKGHIVTVGSACSYHSWGGWGPYTAAKAGLVGFTRCLQVEMGKWGGKASCFIPGAARTGFAAAANLPTDWLEGYPDAKDFARTMVHCLDVPDNCFIEEVNIWGTAQVPAGVNPF